MAGLILYATAYDIAPSQALERVMRVWREGRKGGHLHYGKGDLDENVVTECANCAAVADVVLIGVSSIVERSHGEMAAARTAIEYGRPLAILSDNIGTWTRPHLDPIRNYDRLLVFVMTEEEASCVRTAFPKAHVEVVANPTWTTFIKKRDRERIRKKLGLTNEIAILVTGTKNRSVNKKLIVVALDAAATARTKFGKPFTLLWSPHPGETRNMNAMERERVVRGYHELFALGGVLGSSGATHIPEAVPFAFVPEDFGTHSALAGVEVILGSGSPATATIDAAYHHIPVIDAPGDSFREFIAEESDPRFTPGGVGLTHRPHDLDALVSLLGDVAYGELAPAKAVAAFIERKPDGAESVIVEKLRSFAMSI